MPGFSVRSGGKKDLCVYNRSFFFFRGERIPPKRLCIEVMAMTG